MEYIYLIAILFCLVFPFLICTQIFFKSQLKLFHWMLIITLACFLEGVKFFFILNSPNLIGYYLNEFVFETVLSLFITIALMVRNKATINETFSKMSIITLTIICVSFLFSFLNISMFEEEKFWLLNETFSSIFITIISCTICNKTIKSLEKKVSWSAPIYLINYLFILVINLVNIYLSGTTDKWFETNEGSINSSMLDENVYLLVLSVSLILLTIIVGKNRIDHQKIENQRARTRELEQYIESIELIRDEILSYQHDYDNIFTGFSGYIYNDDIDLEKLREYYEKSARKILKNSSIDLVKVLNIKNIHILELKGLLSQKILLARKKSIHVHLEVSNPIYDFPMDIIDLTMCVGILLDNAIEAADKSEEKDIEIAIIAMENTIVLIIQNSFSQNNNDILSQIGQTRFSTKKNKDGHGFGLSNLRTIISNYDNVTLSSKTSNSIFIQKMTFTV